MKIGIDARALSRTKTGIGNYLEQILRVLNKIDIHNEYILYSPNDIELEPGLENIKKQIHYGPLGPLWMQYMVPYLIAKDQVDLFWSPSYSIPLVRPQKTKAVITIHDMVSFVYPETLPSKTVLHNHIGLPLYVRNVDRIITESQSTKKDILKFLDYSSPTIEVIPLGVNPIYFQQVKNRKDILVEYNIDFPYILTVGTIEPRKNLIRVIEAYARLVEEYSMEHHLVVVGAKGWKYGAIYAFLTKNSNLRDRIHFLGYLPVQDLPIIYQGASLFIYPSFYEGFGLPLLEAMASGVPVITSTVSSMPEVVGNAGLLVNPHITQELADAIRCILSNQDLAESLTNAGIERARTFTWERTAEQTLAVFEQVMNEGSR